MIPLRTRTNLVNVFNNNNNNNDKIKSILSVIDGLVPPPQPRYQLIYETVWFIALLIVIAVLFIVLLIFELYTRHGAAKYPGKLNYYLLQFLLTNPRHSTWIVYSYFSSYPVAPPPPTLDGCNHVHTIPKQGRIQDFFRRGCTLLLLYFNTNKPHSLAEYQLY